PARPPGRAGRRPAVRAGPGAGRVRVALGRREPALGRAGHLGHPVLRVRLHHRPQAPLDPEHRHRRGRRGCAGAGRLVGRDRPGRPAGAGAVRDHLLLDPAPLLGPVAALQGRLRGRRGADAAGGQGGEGDLDPDPVLHGPAGGRDPAAVPGRADGGAVSGRGRRPRGRVHLAGPGAAPRPRRPPGHPAVQLLQHLPGPPVLCHGPGCGGTRRGMRYSRSRPEHPRKRGDRTPMRRARLIGIVLVAVLVLSGCGALTPVTEQGRDIRDLYNILFIAAAIVFVLVEAAIVFAVVRYRRRSDMLPPQFHGNNLLEVVWTAVPLLIVAGLFVVSWGVLNRVDAR